MNIKKILIYLAIFIGIVLLFDKVIMPFYVGGEMVRVPNVVGKSFEDAKQILEQAKLEPVFGGERYDTKFPKDIVILQRPVANKFVKAGRRIYLIVSSGNVKVEVPNVRYKSVDEARIILERAGLSLGKILEDTVHNITRGLITSQSIKPDTMVEKGTQIDVYVSIGETTGNIEVPDLVGRSLSDVKKILESKSLQVGKIIYQPSLDYLPNTVIYQYPAAGTYVQENTPIDLIVIKEKVSGKELIE